MKPYTDSSHSCSDGFRFVKRINEMGRLLQDAEKSMEVLGIIRNEPEHTYFTQILDRGGRMFMLNNNTDARENVYK